MYSPGGLNSQSQTLTASPTNSPLYNATNFTWAPNGCGNIPVPQWRAPCPLGPINTTVIQLWLPIPTLNASVLMMHANVWDAWSYTFGQQLADWTRIPTSQLYVIGAQQCPPPPLWLGYALFYAAQAQNVDCVIVEFVEEPGTARGSGLNAMAALYRIAAAIGGVTQLGRMGDYEVKPLPATGMSPLNYLLAALYQQRSDVGMSGPGVDILSTASWQITNFPVSAFAPSIVPGQPLPGRFNGRLRDLGGLFPAPNAIQQPWLIDPWPIIKSLIAFVVALSAAAVGFFLYRRYYGTRAPRYHRVRRNSTAATLPSKSSAGSASPPRSPRPTAAAVAGTPPPLIAINPLSVLAGLGSVGRKGLTSAPKTSSWTTGWMRYGRAPTERVGGGGAGEEDAVVGVNPVHVAAAASGGNAPRAGSPRAGLELPSLRTGAAEEEVHEGGV